MSIESVMPSNHLILCHPLLPPAIFPSVRAFSSESALRIRWPEYWSFSISPSNEYSGLISFRMDWLDLLEGQGTLKRLLQHHSLKASMLWHSAKTGRQAIVVTTWKQFWVLHGLGYIYLVKYMTLFQGRAWRLHFLNPRLFEKWNQMENNFRLNYAKCSAQVWIHQKLVLNGQITLYKCLCLWPEGSSVRVIWQ